MEFILDTEADDRRRNRAAILLAKTRYSQKYAKWVRKQSARLSYIDEEIALIARQCAEQLDADGVTVEAALRTLISEEIDRANVKAVQVTDPKSVSVTEGPDSLPPAQNTKEVPSPGGEDHAFAEMDIKATEGVLLEELAEGGEMVELASKHSSFDDCPNCEMGALVRDEMGDWYCGAHCGYQSRGVTADYGAGMPGMTPGAAPPPGEGAASLCPTCGMQMQGGRCASCGYSAQPGMGAGTQPGQQMMGCFRCGERLNAVVAQVSPVCADCTEALVKLADGMGGLPVGGGGGLVACPFPTCIWKGSPAELMAHEQQAHPGQVPPTGQQAVAASEEACDKEGCNGTIGADRRCSVCGKRKLYDSERPRSKETKTAGPYPSDPEGQQTGRDDLNPLAEGSPGATEQTDTSHDPVDDKNKKHSPADLFNEKINLMANHQAAETWSTPGDTDISDIAQQYSLDPQDVHKNLKVIATFGDATAVNGDAQGDFHTDGMTELDSFGGRVPTTEEEVDVDSAVQAVGDETGLSPDEVYDRIKEDYGDDIGGQFYASVTGEAHYYLPDSLVGGKADQGQQVQMPAEPQQPPTSGK